MSIKRPKYQEDSEQINISPLIDVLFILLIFFIVTMVFSNRNSLEIDSPKASNSSPSGDDNILISIDRQGLCYYESQAVGLKQLEFVLKNATKQGNIKIMLEADANAPVQSVVSLINMAKGIGVDDVYVVTEKE